MGVKAELFSECVLDFELLSGFDFVVRFAGDNGVASAYVDAIIFATTGKDPSALPGETEFLEGGTEQYRGIAKYDLAKDYFKVSSPESWLFGKEYSKLKTGNSKDFAFVASVSVMIPTIVEGSNRMFSHFLHVPHRDKLEQPARAMTLEENQETVAERRQRNETDKVDSK